MRRWWWLPIRLLLAMRPPLPMYWSGTVYCCLLIPMRLMCASMPKHLVLTPMPNIRIWSCSVSQVLVISSSVILMRNLYRLLLILCLPFLSQMLIFGILRPASIWDWRPLQCGLKISKRNLPITWNTSQILLKPMKNSMPKSQPNLME